MSAATSKSAKTEKEDNPKLMNALKDLQKKYSFTDAYLHYLYKDLEDNKGWESELPNVAKNIQSCEYEILEEVGSGAFGAVYKGKRKKDNMTVAIKIIDLEESKDDIQTINKEIVTLVNGKSCPQLINYYGSAVFGTKLWIAMEYVDGGSILDRVKRKPLTEPEIAVVVNQVLLGLLYLHTEQKIHRDIKAANILVTKSGQVKLADFGASAQLTDTMTKCSTFVGSPYWMAPEVMTQNKYDGKADVWSLGITCFEMATGMPPLHNIPPLRIINMIPRQPSPKLPAGYSTEINDFVDKCLAKDPTQRPEVKVLLKHAFLQSVAKTLASE